MSIQAKINYLYHDGFIVETENHKLIFDYYIDTPKNETRCLESGVICEEDLKTDKKIYVFSSHHHHDHFNPQILNWDKVNSNINYILSSDIDLTEYKRNYALVYENKEIKKDDIYIKCFGSTDIGVSFYVKVDGLSLFHAGDLNWWHWESDTMEDQLSMELSFKRQVRNLADLGNLDIAFFPTDFRLEKYYHMGAEYFINKVNPKLFVPMHYWEKTFITTEFKEKFNSNPKNIPCNIVEIKDRGQTILFSK